MINDSCSLIQNVAETGEYSKLVTPALVLGLAHLMGKLMCDFCLSWIAFILIFTIPAAYKKKKDLIDETYIKVTEQAGGLFD